jgi:hypothetical protein
MSWTPQRRSTWRSGSASWRRTPTAAPTTARSRRRWARLAAAGADEAGARAGAGRNPACRLRMRALHALLACWKVTSEAAPGTLMRPMARWPAAVGRAGITRVRARSARWGHRRQRLGKRLWRPGLPCADPQLRVKATSKHGMRPGDSARASGQWLQWQLPCATSAPNPELRRPRRQRTYISAVRLHLLAQAQVTRAPASAAERSRPRDCALPTLRTLGGPPGAEACRVGTPLSAHSRVRQLTRQAPRPAGPCSPPARVSACGHTTGPSPGPSLRIRPAAVPAGARWPRQSRSRPTSWS